MPFTTPLALLGLLFIPAVVAMYLLKLRRDETIVPSTLLWTRLVADVEANAPWQKLRRSLLLLLQLLLVVILALLAARPFLERPAGPRPRRRAGHRHVGQHGRHGRRAEPPRGGQGGRDRRPARPADGRQGQRHRRRPERPDRGQRDDRPGRVRQALDGIETTEQRTAISATRSSSPGSSPPARATPRSSSRPTARSRRPRPPRSRPGSRSCRSGASARTRRSSRWPSGPRRRRSRARSSSASRTSTSSAPARRLEVWGDGSLIEVRDLLLEPQARSDVVIDDVPRDVGTLELRLVGPDPTVTSAPDQLAVDDRAWAIIPPDRPRLILVVGPGDPYLETALSYLPNVELFGVTAGRVRSGQRTHGRPAVGPGHLRGRPAGDAAAGADPGHRARRPRARSAR